MTLVLHQFDRAYGLPNASPFCMKLETWLRLANVPYELPPRIDFRKAPKGKFPYVELDGRAIADSNFIVDALAARHGDPLDGWLDARTRAQSHAFLRLVEENLYWALIQVRWIDDAAFEVTKRTFFGALPFPLRAIVPLVARRNVRQQFRGHGMGRHAPDEVLAIGAKDVAALAAQLGDRPYLFGDRPTTADTSAFATLANLLWVPIPSPLRDATRAHANLVAYCGRMWKQAFPELPIPTT
jgi:glutathione S-transferase